jgi:hypothetical protein
VRVMAWLIFTVLAGATLPDLDHILPPYQRSWGHDYLIPCIVLAVLVIAYISRLVKSRFLR